MAVTISYMNLGIAIVNRRDFDGAITKLAVAQY